MTPSYDPVQETLCFILYEAKCYFILHLHIIYLKTNKLKGKYISQQVLLLLSALRFCSVLYTGNVRRAHGNRDTNGVYGASIIVKMRFASKSVTV